MASAEGSAPSASSSIPSPESQATASKRLSSIPIEMNSLSAPTQPEQAQPSAIDQSHPQTGHDTKPSTTEGDTTAAGGFEQNQSNTTSNYLNFDPREREPLPLANASNASPDTPSSHPQLTRMETAPAIGPATDRPTTINNEASEGPVLFITLLLASTGARHPYKLDGKYLKKRQVEVEGNNPINMSLYKLKELILRDWRSEWDAKPSSPESIRLIFMGKMLNDRTRLTDNGFTNSATPQIVHMAIKPQEIVDEEEANKATGKDRDGNERSPGCRCVIQ